MSRHATGTFDVKTTPQGESDKGEGSTLGRMSLDKQFHGDIEGVSKGEMLFAGTEVKGSAVYVAIERVTGTLDGKKGSFALYHTGVMQGPSQELAVVVVPDSGSGQLTGITGKMTITITGGKHLYDFDYTLP